MNQLEGTISLQVTGKCKNCPCLDPIIRRINFGFEPINVVYCKNEELCAHIEKRLAALHTTSEQAEET